ncbi:MAG TPA: sigma-70 family RNA polymerase sigma factor [Acidobacteria bacterium]|nr:sigma-70 family RNA polymerase sigma factor [Acidobacteriota bacterium]
MRGPAPAILRGMSERQPDWAQIRKRDRRIVARCLRGDEDAWAELWQCYGPLVKATARRAGCDEEECRDVLQRVALIALQNLERLREPAKLPAWLAGIARFQGLEMARKRGRTEELQPWSAVLESDPEGELDRERRLNALRQAMLELDERCRRMIHRLDLKEPKDSYREVAEDEGLSPASVGPIRRRCLERLKKIFVKLSQTAPAAH